MRGGPNGAERSRPLTPCPGRHLVGRRCAHGAVLSHSFPVHARGFSRGCSPLRREVIMTPPMPRKAKPAFGAKAAFVRAHPSISAGELVTLAEQEGMSLTVGHI